VVTSFDRAIVKTPALKHMESLETWVQAVPRHWFGDAATEQRSVGDLMGFRLTRVLIGCIGIVIGI
jgi:hypothetical protein